MSPFLLQDFNLDFSGILASSESLNEVGLN